MKSIFKIFALCLFLPIATMSTPSFLDKADKWLNANKLDKYGNDEGMTSF